MIEPGRPELFIGRCTGQALPQDEMRDIEAALAAKGLSLEKTLRDVRAYEQSLVVGNYVKLPETLVRQLDAIAATPGMELRRDRESRMCGAPGCTPRARRRRASNETPHACGRNCRRAGAPQ